jgi:hypothetical protein
MAEQTAGLQGDAAGEIWNGAPSGDPLDQGPVIP